MHFEPIHGLHAIHHHGLRGRFARSAYNFLVVFVSDQDDGAAFAREFQRLQMHLGHQRASRVDYAQLPRLRLAAHRRRHAVRAEHQHSAFRHVFDGLHENCAVLAQPLDHVAVMHDFVVDVHRRPIGLQRQLDNVHGAHYASAEASRAHSEQNFPVLGFG